MGRIVDRKRAPSRIYKIWNTHFQHVGRDIPMFDLKAGFLDVLTPMDDVISSMDAEPLYDFFLRGVYDMLMNIFPSKGNPLYDFLNFR